MSRVTITDRDGWRKDISLQKAIVYIGSDPGNDIVLDGIRGSGVAPRHAQLLAMASNGQGCRLVNLGTSDIMVGMGTSRTISPFNSTALGEGESIKIGDFTLLISGMEMQPAMAALPAASAATLAATAATAAALAAPASSGPRAALPAAGQTTAAADVATTAESIGLRLSLPDLPIMPGKPIEGSIIVKNQGSRPGAQFKLQVEGIDPSLFEIGPAPILFPNAEKEVFLRIKHPNQPNPPAGDCRIVVRATAPDAYPREVAAVTQIVKIAPFFEHKLRIVGAS